MEEETFRLFSLIPSSALFAFQWTSYVKSLFFPLLSATATSYSGASPGFVIYLFI